MLFNRVNGKSQFKLICHTLLAIGPLILILVLYVIYDEAITYRLTGGYFPGGVPVYIILSLIPLSVAGELRLMQTKTDNFLRLLCPLWIIAPVVILALFMFSDSGSLKQIATLIIVYSCIPLIIVVLLRLMATRPDDNCIPLHPFGIIAPIGILVLFMFGGLWGHVANKIPSVSYGGTYKVLRTWPDSADDSSEIREVWISYAGIGKTDTVKFVSGRIGKDGFDGEPVLGVVGLNLDNMTCSWDSKERYALNVESLSKLLVENGLPMGVEDSVQVAKGAYQSIMEVKAAKSEDDLDSTYEPMWSYMKDWAVRLVGSIMVAIVALPLSFLFANRYLKKLYCT